MAIRNKMPYPRKLLLTSTILFSISLLIFLFGLSPTLVFNYYSTGIYPVISICLRWFSSIFPFALGDMLYFCLLIFAFIQFFLLFKNRKSLTKNDRFIIPLKTLNILFVLYISFKLLWGLNYSRPSISSQLSIHDNKYSVKELISLSNFFIDRLNGLQPKINPKQTYTLKEIKDKSVLAYRKMQQKQSFFTYHVPSFKPSLSGWATSTIGIEGYYNPLTGEANLNMLLPSWVLPFVACHEISHQLGVAREDEANLVGYLTAVNSDDVNFQYSANYNMLRYLLLEVRIKSPEDYEALYKKITPGVLANFKAESEFWQKYNSEMSGYMNVAFDKFLKLNNQKKGIKSYQNIVIWLWNVHKSEVLSR
ncbi:DUF3810 domain-containing protein [Pedobacter sp. Du54]|uniref:DUF3810 domain-containing protein n=1 Tax=Pedobacter anseongensis TaxID=3133439 RepID=UPI0030B65219